MRSFCGPAERNARAASESWSGGAATVISDSTSRG
jgi:hypothetical protein